jgi:hypothetical protein
MDTATRVLVVGGMSVLAAGLLLGIPMAAARNKAPRAPRYLLIAHLAAIIQGGLLLALTVAMGFSIQSKGIETTAASVLVGGVGLFILGNAMNWLHGTQDAFADKTVGNKVAAAGTPLILVGAGIILYGVVAAL